ncbi:hypothetical protein ACFFX0_08795 [Citricoccus parietis]|uniref:Secreted protein n=1 Tax=Citricoccus parietis TaxID=592307 RepID=A0ABV5FX82_9MICC
MVWAVVIVWMATWSEPSWSAAHRTSSGSDSRRSSTAEDAVQLISPFWNPSMPSCSAGRVRCMAVNTNWSEAENGSPVAGSMPSWARMRNSWTERVRESSTCWAMPLRCRA